MRERGERERKRGEREERVREEGREREEKRERVRGREGLNRKQKFFTGHIDHQHLLKCEIKIIV